MLSFLAKNLGTIVIAAIIAAALFMAVRSMVKASERGESFACGGDCAHCGHCDPIRDAQKFEEFKRMQEMNNKNA